MWSHLLFVLVIMSAFGRPAQSLSASTCESLFPEVSNDFSTIVPGSWVSFGVYNEYMLSTTVANFSFAQSTCVEQGAHLVYINSWLENDFVYCLNRSAGARWIGGQLTWSRDVFRKLQLKALTWVSGDVFDFGLTEARSPLGQAPWASKEPNNYGMTEFCILQGSNKIGSKAYNTNLWNDFKCSAARKFVCKRTRTANPAVTRTTTTSPGQVDVSNCVGSFGEFGNCSLACNGGYQYQTYSITTNATRGGTPCPFVHGYIRGQLCNSALCPVVPIPPDSSPYPVCAGIPFAVNQWMINENFQYYSGDAKLNWTNAQLQCQSMGANLASHASLQEMYFTFCLDIRSPKWIGGKLFWGTVKPVQVVKQTWVDGTSFSSFGVLPPRPLAPAYVAMPPWYPGEPNKEPFDPSVEEYCMEQGMVDVPNATWLWNDRSCGVLRSFLCKKCAPGWTGVYCETNIDDCRPDPCLNAGICQDRLNDFECICPLYYHGHRCEIRVTPTSTMTTTMTTTMLSQLNLGANLAFMRDSGELDGFIGKASPECNYNGNPIRVFYPRIYTFVARESLPHIISVRSPTGILLQYGNQSNTRNLTVFDTILAVYESPYKEEDTPNFDVSQADYVDCNDDVMRTPYKFCGEQINPDGSINAIGGDTQEYRQSRWYSSSQVSVPMIQDRVYYIQLGSFQTTDYHGRVTIIIDYDFRSTAALTNRAPSTLTETVPSVAAFCALKSQFPRTLPCEETCKYIDPNEAFTGYVSVVDPDPCSPIAPTAICTTSTMTSTVTTTFTSTLSPEPVTYAVAGNPGIRRVNLGLNTVTQRNEQPVFTFEGASVQGDCSNPVTVYHSHTYGFRSTINHAVPYRFTLRLPVGQLATATGADLDFKTDSVLVVTDVANLPLKCNDDIVFVEGKNDIRCAVSDVYEVVQDSGALTRASQLSAVLQYNQLYKIVVGNHFDNNTATKLKLIIDYDYCHPAMFDYCSSLDIGNTTHSHVPNAACPDGFKWQCTGAVAGKMPCMAVPNTPVVVPGGPLTIGLREVDVSGESYFRVFDPTQPGYDSLPASDCSATFADLIANNETPRLSLYNAKRLLFTPPCTAMFVISLSSSRNFQEDLELNLDPVMILRDSSTALLNCNDDNTDCASPTTYSRQMSQFTTDTLTQGESYTIDIGFYIPTAQGKYNISIALAVDNVGSVNSCSYVTPGNTAPGVGAITFSPCNL